MEKISYFTRLFSLPSTVFSPALLLWQATQPKALKKTKPNEGILDFQFVSRHAGRGAPAPYPTRKRSTDKP